MYTYVKGKGWIIVPQYSAITRDGTLVHFEKLSLEDLVFGDYFDYGIDYKEADVKSFIAYTSFRNLPVFTPSELRYFNNCPDPDRSFYRIVEG